MEAPGLELAGISNQHDAGWTHRNLAGGRPKSPGFLTHVFPHLLSFLFFSYVDTFRCIFEPKYKFLNFFLYICSFALVIRFLYTFHWSLHNIELNCVPPKGIFKCYSPAPVRATSLGSRIFAGRSKLTGGSRG